MLEFLGYDLVRLWLSSVQEPGCRSGLRPEPWWISKVGVEPELIFSRKAGNGVEPE